MKNSNHSRTIIIAAIILTAIALLWLYLSVPTPENPITDLKNKHLKESADAVAKAKSLEAVVKMQRDSIARLTAANHALDNKIADLRRRREKNAREIAQYSAEQIADYLKSRYNAGKVQAVGNSVTVVDTVGRLVVDDLSAGDNCAEELAVTGIMLSNEKKAGKHRDSIITVQEQQKLLLEAARASMESAYELQGIQLRDQEKSNKKLRRRELLWKVTVSAAAAAGFFIGKPL